MPLRPLNEITAGDVLVFRESGRRDVIRALADAQIGPEAPAIRDAPPAGIGRFVNRVLMRRRS